MFYSPLPLQSSYRDSRNAQNTLQWLQSATGNLNHLGLSRPPPNPTSAIRTLTALQASSKMSFMPSSNIWDSTGVVFIVRGKDNIQFESIRERDLPDTTSQEILIDEEVRLTGVETASKYPKKIRRIGIYNVQGGYTIDLYTNDFKHAASTIAALYRSRWKIEIFFRDLKQNLHIKSFLGTSQNAVEIQIWTALITILLLQYLKRIAKHTWCLSNLTASLRLNTFTKIDLFQWINEPFSPPPDEPEIA